MVRVKLVKDCKQGKSGSTVFLSNNEAFGLIDSGFAVVSKDMAPDDYKQAGAKSASNRLTRRTK